MVLVRSRIPPDLGVLAQQADRDQQQHTGHVGQDVAAGEPRLVGGIRLRRRRRCSPGHHGILGSSPATASSTTTPATMVAHQSTPILASRSLPVNRSLRSLHLLSINAFDDADYWATRQARDSFPLIDTETPSPLLTATLRPLRRLADCRLHGLRLALDRCRRRPSSRRVPAEVLHRTGHALVEAHLRPPAQNLVGQADVEAGSLQVTRAAADGIPDRRVHQLLQPLLNAVGGLRFPRRYRH